MKFLNIKLECPDCGNILHKEFPASDIKILKKTLDTSGKCSCGKKSGFKILDFSSIEYEPIKEK